MQPGWPVTGTDVSDLHYNTCILAFASESSSAFSVYLFLLYIFLKYGEFYMKTTENMNRIRYLTMAFSILIIFLLPSAVKSFIRPNISSYGLLSLIILSSQLFNIFSNMNVMKAAENGKQHWTENPKYRIFIAAICILFILYMMLQAGIQWFFIIFIVNAFISIFISVFDMKSKTSV